MADLVGTCPKDFWEEWIAEGDAAGDPETGEEWGWYTSHRLAASIEPGDRFYVVSHGKLRGWATVTRVEKTPGGFIICRRADAVACTIPEPVPGFRGLRLRWWKRDDERPFPDWKGRVKPRLNYEEFIRALGRRVYGSELSERYWAEPKPFAADESRLAQIGAGT